MAAASARAGRKTLMVRFGGVKGGGREQFGGCLLYTSDAADE